MLDSEKKGLELVKRLGIATATSRLEALGSKAKALIEAEMDAGRGHTLSGLTALDVMSKSEREEHFLITTGLGLLTPCPVTEGKNRVAIRCAKRQLNRPNVKALMKQHSISEETMLERLIDYARSKPPASIEQFILNH